MATSDLWDGLALYSAVHEHCTYQAAQASWAKDAEAAGRMTAWADAAHAALVALLRREEVALREVVQDDTNTEVFQEVSEAVNTYLALREIGRAAPAPEATPDITTRLDVWRGTVLEHERLCRDDDARLTAAVGRHHPHKIALLEDELLAAVKTSAVVAQYGHFAALAPTRARALRREGERRRWAVVRDSEERLGPLRPGIDAADLELRALLSERPPAAPPMPATSDRDVAVTEGRSIYAEIAETAAAGRSDGFWHRRLDAQPTHVRVVDRVLDVTHELGLAGAMSTRAERPGTAKAVARELQRTADLLRINVRVRILELAIPWATRDALGLVADAVPELPLDEARRMMKDVAEAAALARYGDELPDNDGEVASGTGMSAAESRYRLRGILKSYSSRPIRVPDVIQVMAVLEDARRSIAYEWVREAAEPLGREALFAADAEEVGVQAVEDAMEDVVMRHAAEYEQVRTHD